MAKGGKKAAAAARAAANRLLADNRQARHQYEILETLETGIELVGTEVKSIRAGKANLRDGFCRNGELQLMVSHLPHSHAGATSTTTRCEHETAGPPPGNRQTARPARSEGTGADSAQPPPQGSWIKITIGLGKGRKLHDKRAAEKEKQVKRKEASAATDPILRNRGTWMDGRSVEG